MAVSDIPRSQRRSSRVLRQGVAASIAFAIAVFTGAIIVPTAARADGPTTFTNTASIAIPATGSADQVGPASPYPSNIAVSGLAGALTKVQVVFTGFTHPTLNDVDAMVVSPTGQNLVVLSDIGDPATLAFASNATLTFDDAAAGPVPTGGVVTGTYRPTNSGGAESFPAPAPAPSAQTTLAGAFTGIDPNGTWQLFIVDDATGDIGSMAGGWSLVITTEVSAVATTTTLTTSGSPSTTGSPVTFTATVSGAGSPVTTGTVAFTVDGAPIGGVPVNASGVAQITTSALAEGSHTIVGTYSGSLGYLTSNGSVSQRVDNATTVSGSTYCNTGTLTIPSNGPAVPYPSNITVSGLSGAISKVTVTLNGLSHAVPVDLDVMLAGPVPSTNLMLMSDVGATAAVSAATIVFDDAAADPVPTPLTSGTFRPTDDDSDSADAAFPAPAPIVSSATTLATFNGATANGVWSLWVLDDATGDAGSISGGWCLTFITQTPTVTAVASSLNPSDFGGAVTFTATVTAAGAPVTAGSVSFSDGGSPLGAGIPVNANGTATFTTSALATGTHPITATYGGAAAYAPSAASLSQVVQEPIVADAGGPYVVAEGGTLGLDGSSSTPGAIYEWDVNGDGDYTDAAGATPMLTWEQLEALGIDDGPSTHAVTLRVTLGARYGTDAADLDVVNTAPDAVVTGGATATAGLPFTVKAGADDPSSADMAAEFVFTVDWGDGSPVESVSGPADPPITHTYTAEGTYTATLTSTDKDGGTGEPRVIQVVVAASPEPTPVPVPPSSTPLPPTGADSGGTALAAALLILLGASMVALARTRRPARRM